MECSVSGSTRCIAHDFVSFVQRKFEVFGAPVAEPCLQGLRSLQPDSRYTHTSGTRQSPLRSGL
jgi:hypothetical protein